MPDFLKYVLYTLFLHIVETIVYIVEFEVELIQRDLKINLDNIKQAIFNAFEIIGLRFIFYYIIYIVSFYVGLKLIRWKNRTLQCAVTNCLIYIIISGIFGLLIPHAYEFFYRDFFFFSIIATFISPLILNRIRFFRNIITDNKAKK
jgi:hypothetical protein